MGSVIGEHLGAGLAPLAAGGYGGAVVGVHHCRDASWISEAQLQVVGGRLTR